MYEPGNCVYLAAAVVLCAVNDMRRGDIDAILFLCSEDAAWWLAHAGLDRDDVVRLVDSGRRYRMPAPCGFRGTL